MSSRFAAAVTLAVASALGLALLLRSLLRLADGGIHRPDQAVTFGVLAVGVLLLGWYLATAVAAAVCLTARAAGHVWSAGERRLSGLGAPVARRLLLATGSVAVAAATALSPATAAPPEPAVVAGHVATLGDDLGWGATEDEQPAEPEQGSAEERTASEDPPEPGLPVETTSSSTDDQTYTVVADDSLWTIAARHLPPDSTDAEVAASWPDWYAQNRDVIGDDPGLIHPGQVLTAPDHDTEEEA